MRLLIPAFLFLSSSIGLASHSSGSADIQSIRLVISQSTTQEDLNKMQEFLKDNGYEMTIDDKVYDEDGNLQSIRGAVDFGKTSGTFNAKDLTHGTLVIQRSILGKLSIEITPKE